MEYDPADWLEGTVLGVTKRSPTQSDPIVFLNTYTGQGVDQFPDNQWVTVDVSQIVPEKSVAVFLSGLLLITHGTSVETADLKVYFRADGDNEDYKYDWQTVEASTANGQRSTMAVWVPLSADRKFQFKWQRSTSGQYPDHSAYGVNLVLNAYLR